MVINHVSNTHMTFGLNLVEKCLVCASRVRTGCRLKTDRTPNIVQFAKRPLTQYTFIYNA